VASLAFLWASLWDDAVQYGFDNSNAEAEAAEAAAANAAAAADIS
jgi:hypothetical protein